MKEKELRQHAKCSLCRKPIMHAGLPLFYRVTVERFGIDMRAAQRQQGLGMMLSPSLAMVMGPDEDMAMPMMEPVTITVCEHCSTEMAPCIAALPEYSTPDEDSK
jgi:hypothetical protein